MEALQDGSREPSRFCRKPCKQWPRQAKSRGCACRAPELLKEKAYLISLSFPVSKFVAHHKLMKLGDTVTLDFRRSDCQLCVWGKHLAGQRQPHLGSLHIRLGYLIVKLEPFDQMPKLYDSASFDWGGVSSEHQLAACWKLDLQQHPTVYHQLADQLGETHLMAKLIAKELAKEVEDPASTSSASLHSPASGRIHPRAFRKLWVT